MLVRQEEWADMFCHGNQCLQPRAAMIKLQNRAAELTSKLLRTMTRHRSCVHLRSSKRHDTLDLKLSIHVPPNT